jgi:hypothetical protein
LKSKDKRRARLAVMDNTTSDSSENDIEMLRTDFCDDDLLDMGVEINPEQRIKDPAAKLKDTFLVAPMSVLNTRDGEWQDRKRAWHALLNVGQGETRENTLGLHLLTNVMYGKTCMKNVSIFDCALAELMFNWFAPTISVEKKVCDPFAGDIAKGGVFSYLGAEFTGIELRQEQIDQNIKDIGKASWGKHCKYIKDSGENITKHIKAGTQDLMFSCPPYFDLEVYSDDPQDASNQKNYAGFISIIEKGLQGGVECLKDNRFAIIVMSNVRRKDGCYNDICSDIVRIMEKAGARLYNEFILVNTVGTGAIRARRNMETRKNTRCHQEVLVFYKGKDVKDIKNDFGKCSFANIKQDEDEQE